MGSVKRGLAVAVRGARLPTMLDKAGTDTLAALLAWYRAMGVDQPVGEAPLDWLGRGDRAPGQAFRLRDVAG